MRTCREEGPPLGKGREDAAVVGFCRKRGRGRENYLQAAVGGNAGC